MNAQDILKQLEPLGAESYRKVLRNHGIPEPMFGVKIEELKKIQKRIKRDYQLALDLYDTGIYDARYLAGLIADDALMTKDNLNHWLDSANCASLCEYTIAWVASSGPHGGELARDWIESDAEQSQVAGWSTFSSLVSITADEELDLAELKRLLQRVEKSIHKQPNRTRYAMNGFVIALGAFVLPFTDLALQTADKIGKVHVDMGNTSCKIPSAREYLQKIRDRGTLGKKRKSAKC